jgi:hypothetical protein
LCGKIQHSFCAAFYLSFPLTEKKSIFEGAVFKEPNESLDFSLVLKLLS